MAEEKAALLELPLLDDAPPPISQRPDDPAAAAARHQPSLLARAAIAPASDRSFVPLGGIARPPWVAATPRGGVGLRTPDRRPPSPAALLVLPPLGARSTGGGDAPLPPLSFDLQHHPLL